LPLPRWLARLMLEAAPVSPLMEEKLVIR
jgi:hypothetical protein